MPSDKLTRYRNAQHPIPEKMLRWHLYGAGLENLGKDGQPEEVPVPEPGDDELLVRIDALGLCFSDTKVVSLGEKHPRLVGRDLRKEPVVLGHEVSCTVVKVGKNLQDRFKVGQRFIVQADVFYQGKSIAYGYVLPGAMTQYGIIGKEIIEGDEGCYLLPIRDEDGYVEAALVEPWACVVASYNQKRRQHIRHDGEALLIMGERIPHTEFTLGEAITPSRRPRRVVALGASGQIRADLVNLASTSGLQWVEDTATVDSARRHAPEGGYDDILCIGELPAEVVEGVADLLAKGGVLWVLRRTPFDRCLSLDIGRIHYDSLWCVGAFGNDLSQANAVPLRAELLAGGTCWIVGGGGPMGQMHVQRAVQLPEPPALIVATDVDAVRLEAVRERYAATAERRGIRFVAINPKELSPEQFHAKLLELTDGKGFTDIVNMVPVAEVVADSARLLADGGVYNIFAGVARGVKACLDYNAICGRNVRFFGSSGSSLADIRLTLEQMESGQLQTRASLAAIGGMKAAHEGIRALMEARFPGKTVIFPQIPDLPLMSLAELKEKFPTVYAKLENGRFWTREAEEELLNQLLEVD
ncbi:MAG: alcohol dehydrogenase catalytic domain-containing protein [Chthonomonadetes bacterium]|nr:alcohol dehydrogenase catalytic domain-containing protein [Chthonomonadetes bacterium]